MKKISLFALLLLVAFTVGHFAYAESNSNDDKYQNRERSGHVFKPFRGMMGNKPEKVQVGGEVERNMSKKAMVEHRFLGALRMLDFTYARLDNVINALNDGGFDTNAAEAKKDIAKDKIDDAKDAVEDLKSYVTSIINATVSPDNSGKHPNLTDEQKAKIKDLAMKAKEAVKAAHQALKDTHKEIVLLIDDSNDDSDDEDEQEDN